LDGAGLLDGGSVGLRIHGPLRSWAPGRLLLRGAAVDAQNFAYLGPLGPWTGADLERGARRYATVAAALDHTHVQEGVARAIGKLYEAEPLVGVVPFDYGLDRGPEGASNLWALDPDAAPKLRRGVSKLSSSKPRRRLGRKSLS